MSRPRRGPDFTPRWGRSPARGRVPPPVQGVPGLGPVPHQVQPTRRRTTRRGGGESGGMTGQDVTDVRRDVMPLQHPGNRIRFSTGSGRPTRAHRRGQPRHVGVLPVALPGAWWRRSGSRTRRRVPPGNCDQPLRRPTGPGPPRCRSDAQDPSQVAGRARLRSLGNQEVDLPEPLRSPAPRRHHRHPDRTAGPREPRPGATNASRANCSSSATGSAHRRSAGSSSGAEYLRHRCERPTHHGDGSCAPRRRPCWPWTSSTSTARSP